MNLLKLPGKDPVDNMEWRLELRRVCAEDAKIRAAVRTVCREDPIYFFNAFCWLYEPRPRFVNGKELPKVIPFVTWPHQDKVVREIVKHLGKRDIGIEKSRAEGASWIGVLLALQNWIFKDMTPIGVVSRNLLTADNPSDPDSISWKLIWQLSKLPMWMVGKEQVDWRYDRSKHTLNNLRNGSTITSYAATGDVGTGGRKAWFLCDEVSKWPAGLDEEAMASTQHVTDCRLVVSTPKGASGAYYEMMHEPSNLVKLTLAWEDNPTKNRGLYKFVRGKPVAIDAKHNNIPKSYSPPNQEIQDLFSRLRKKGFNLQTGVRSPWYDQECDRPRATPQAIAQELDRDYGGSSYRIFTHEVMAQIQKTSTKPLLRGELLTSDDQTLFEQRPDGQMGLWCQLDLDGKPPERGYVIGCDIGAGLGGSYTSNSVIQVIDGVTRNQVLEFASNTMQPAEFADLAISVARWFHNAYLAWEANGIGGAFGARVLEQRYANVFRKPIFNQKKKVVSNKLGWWTSKDTKEQLFSDMIIAIKQDRLTVRSAQVIDEMNQYIRVAGKIECMASLTSKSDADKGEAHGDRVMALGIALQALKDRPIPLKLDDPVSGRSKEPPLGTMARRLWEAAQKSKEDDGWDDRLVSDMRGRRA